MSLHRFLPFVAGVNWSVAPLRCLLSPLQEKGVTIRVPRSPDVFARCPLALPAPYLALTPGPVPPFPAQHRLPPPAHVPWPQTTAAPRQPPSYLLFPFRTLPAPPGLLWPPASTAPSPALGDGMGHGTGWPGPCSLVARRPASPCSGCSPRRCGTRASLLSAGSFLGKLTAQLCSRHGAPSDIALAALQWCRGVEASGRG